MAASRVLLTDLYELTMLQAYFYEGLRDVAAFNLFVRRLPERRNYLVACGLDEVLGLLETLTFDEEALAYLGTLGQFSDRFLGQLATFRFTGDVYAVAEGTPVFSNEPILEIVAPLPEAQFVESLVMNQIHLQTLLASKAVRVVAAARGRQVVDFGLRRAHGLDAGLKAARAFHVAGVHATSNVAAGQAYGLRVSGTMAHSYVQAHDSEYEAFRRFAERYPGTTLVVDTYDAVAGVRQVIALAARMGAAFNVAAIRLDSGDLGQLAVEARRLLDAAGLFRVGIFASGNLNEDEIDRLLSAGAPIDGFGVGTDMAVSRDAPSLDIAYKLVEYGGRGRVKLSPDKRVLPGRKQIFRIEKGGQVERDLLGAHDDVLPGRPLLCKVMAGGARLPESRKTLDEIRTHAMNEVQKLPARLRSLVPADPPYRVDLSEALARHREALGLPHER